MNEPLLELPPEIDFSSFDFPNLTNSFLSDAATLQSIGEKYFFFFLGKELYAVASEQFFLSIFSADYSDESRFCSAKPARSYQANPKRFGQCRRVVIATIFRLTVRRRRNKY